MRVLDARWPWCPGALISNSTLQALLEGPQDLGYRNIFPWGLRMVHHRTDWAKGSRQDSGSVRGPFRPDLPHELQ